MIANAASRVLEDQDAGVRTVLRPQITDAGHEITTLEVPLAAAAIVRKRIG